MSTSVILFKLLDRREHLQFDISSAGGHIDMPKSNLPGEYSTCAAVENQN